MYYIQYGNETIVEVLTYEDESYDSLIQAINVADEMLDTEVESTYKIIKVNVELVYEKTKS